MYVKVFGNVAVFMLDSRLPRVRKMSGKIKFSPGQGKVREFSKKCQGILAFGPYEGIVREFYDDVMSGNCQGILS